MCVCGGAQVHGGVFCPGTDGGYADASCLGAALCVVSTNRSLKFEAAFTPQRCSGRKAEPRVRLSIANLIAKHLGNDGDTGLVTPQTSFSFLSGCEVKRS